MAVSTWSDRTMGSAGMRRAASSFSRMHSDTANTIVYDPERREYVMYCRAKDVYRIGRGDVLDVGESRRVARMASPELWGEWKAAPRNILIPDELDSARAYTAFYGMSVQRYAGIFWGFLQVFKWNTEISAELAFSRDGVRFRPSARSTETAGPGSRGDLGQRHGGGCQSVGRGR